MLTNTSLDSHPLKDGPAHSRRPPRPAIGRGAGSPADQWRDGPMGGGWATPPATIGRAGDNTGYIT
ncbi:hypothetical protein E2C01_079973 [Portunus trituberculatus]|uniref:Uncharacterized protein n=1 Tax=Portunus trituberculatus TaxID=210409 RepID=A0A5B7ISR8_PORTR|nr:hypothetical protein [Portunus trituberculatus]